MRLEKYIVLLGVLVFSLFISCHIVKASPWAAVGDIQLRNDVEILARHGVISGPVNTWPISWKQITRNLSHSSEMNLPLYVRLAVIRVTEKVPGDLRTTVKVQTSNAPAIIRGFQKTARNDIDVEVTTEYNSNRGTTIHLQGGYRKGNNEGYTHLDGSYLSQNLGNWSVYAGVFERWWGPGRESSLIMSNNARPMPSIGFRRLEPKAFETRWLSWLGPWQWDMFIAKMEKDRHIQNTLFVGMRFSFEPVKNFEVGLSRTMQLCGANRPCNIETWARALIGGGNLDNNRGETTEPGNQLASIDFSYSQSVGNGTFLKLYIEGTAEDETNFLPYRFAKLAGINLYGPYAGKGAYWLLSAEYSNTTSTQAWLFGKQLFNTIYEHNIYRTGYRYKNRAIGHSLDSDSKLFTVSAQFNTSNNWEYSIKYHNAKINIDGTSGNILLVPNKNIEIFEAYIRGNVGFGNIQINLRHASDRVVTLDPAQNSLTSVGLIWELEL